MGNGIRAGSENVIQVDKDAPESAQDRVHHMLKGLACCTQNKGMWKNSENAEGSRNGRLAVVLGGDRNLVIPMDEVHLGENGHTRKGRRKILKVGNRISVGH